MAVQTIIPSSNVAMVDIRDTLNSAGGVVDNSLVSFFSASAKINKWAKYKPTKYYGLNFATGNESPLQWQAGNGLCGFTEASIVFIDADSLVAAYKAGSTFVYELPTGGSSYPYRLGDYRGYYPSAKAPIWSFTYTGQMASNNPSSSSTFTILGDSDINTSYNLRMSDILPDGDTALSTYYFGIIIVNSSGSVALTKKSTSPIGTSAGFTQGVTVTQEEVGVAGKYTAYPVFMDATGKSFVACPIAPIEFQIVTSVDADKVGWMDGSMTVSNVGKFTIGAQIGYSKSFGGTNVRITPVVAHANGQIEELASYETVTLPATTSDTGHYDYSRTLGIQSVSTGDKFRLVMYYGSNFGNIATIEYEEEL